MFIGFKWIVQYNQNLLKIAYLFVGFFQKDTFVYSLLPRL